MKQRLFFTLLIVFSLSSWAEQQPLTLRQQMAAMGYLIDEIWVQSAEPKNYPAAAEKVADLRSRLTISIGLTPEKISLLAPEQRKIATADYHQLMARVIYLTASLEKTLRQPGLEPVSQSRERDVQNLLREISIVVGKGHGAFR